MEALAAARGSEGRGYRRRGCQRRCGGAAAAARRGLLAGTAPLRRAPPTADTDPAPDIAPPTPPPSAAHPEPEAPPPRPAAAGPSHGLVAPPTTRLLCFLCSDDPGRAALAPPRFRWTTPSPVRGPAAPPSLDSLPWDTDRRAAPGTRLAEAAAEPARPLKGTGSPGISLKGSLSPTSSAKEASLLSHPNSPDPKFPRGARNLGVEGLADRSIRRCIRTLPHFRLGGLDRPFQDKAAFLLSRLPRVELRQASRSLAPKIGLDTVEPAGSRTYGGPVTLEGVRGTLSEDTGNATRLLSLGFCSYPAP